MVVSADSVTVTSFLATKPKCTSPEQGCLSDRALSGAGGSAGAQVLGQGLLSLGWRGREDTAALHGGGAKWGEGLMPFKHIHGNPRAQNPATFSGVSVPVGDCSAVTGRCLQSLLFLPLGFLSGALPSLWAAQKAAAALSPISV